VRAISQSLRRRADNEDSLIGEAYLSEGDLVPEVGGILSITINRWTSQSRVGLHTVVGSFPVVVIKGRPRRLYDSRRKQELAGRDLLAQVLLSLVLLGRRVAE